MTADAFLTRLSRDCLILPGSHVLVALSGGADSTALLCLLLDIAEQYPLRVSCAHVEHGIRGGESLEDLDFVRALCGEKGVALYAAHVDAPAYAKAHGCGMEDAARRLRYDFLYQTADAIGADAIALAHHAMDQAETVLIHAMRGSDVRGLCAMRYRSGRLIRPLLDANPQQLKQMLTDRAQQWREDASNQDERYLRNRIRHGILPAMESAMTGAGAALNRLSRAAQRDEDFFSAQLDALNLPVISLVDGLAVEKEALCALHPALGSRMLIRLMEQAGIEAQRSDVIGAVLDALSLEEAVINLSADAHAYVGRRYLCLLRAQQPIEEIPLNIPGRTMTPFGVFDVQPAQQGETGDGKTAQRIPLRLLEGAYVSARREGDIMIPFGKRSPVKLKKLMIDARIERAMRQSIPIVRDRDGNVLFAVGLRPAERCRASKEDKQMIVRFGGSWPEGTKKDKN